MGSAQRRLEDPTGIRTQSRPSDRPASGTLRTRLVADCRSGILCLAGLLRDGSGGRVFLVTAAVWCQRAACAASGLARRSLGLAGEAAGAFDRCLRGDGSNPAFALPSDCLAFAER